NDEFSPRSSETVEQLKITEEERKKRAEAEEEAFRVFKARIKDPDIELPKSIFPLLETMEEIAAEAGNLDATKVREVRDFLHNFCEKNNVHIATIS
ncbi:MAG TPA: hypothetical protein PKH93_12320, partial [Chitinophagales bacterium]|nr:hypothetical protein [Chitinophagales bacterium]